MKRESAVSSAHFYRFLAGRGSCLPKQPQLRILKSVAAALCLLPLMTQAQPLWKQPSLTADKRKLIALG